MFGALFAGGLALFLFGASCVGGLLNEEVPHSESQLRNPTHKWWVKTEDGGWVRADQSGSCVEKEQ